MDFRNIFKEIYSPDSFDAIYDQADHLKAVNYLGYRNHRLTLLSTFFGLPNQSSNGNGLTWTQIGNNLLGLQEGKTSGRNSFNKWTSPFTLVKNLLVALLKTGHNTAKLFTEFLPLALSEGLDDLKSYLGRIALESLDMFGPFGFLAFIVLGACAAIAYIASMACYAARFAGRAITSPIDSMRAAWYFFVPPTNPATSVGVIAGIHFVFFSIAVTTFLSMLIFPPLFPLFGITLPVMASVLTPGLISFFSAIGAPFMLNLGVGFTLLNTGLVATMALVVTFIGSLINLAVQTCKEKWDNTSNLADHPELSLDERTAILERTNTSVLLFNPSYKINSEKEQELETNNQYTITQGTPSNTGLFRPINDPEMQRLTQHQNDEKEREEHINTYQQ